MNSIVSFCQTSSFKSLPARSFLAGMTLIIAACATTPTISSGSKTSGTWEVKAQASDLETKKSYNLSLDFLVIAPSSLRLDATGPMGVNIASLAIQKNEIQYALYRKKRYYEGQVSDHAMQALFKLKMNPRWFINICTDQEIRGDDWSCQSNSEGLPDVCERKSDRLKIVWSGREENKKRVSITDKSFELQMLFKSYTPVDPTKVQSEKSPFHIDPPKDFSQYKIP